MPADTLGGVQTEARQRFGAGRSALVARLLDDALATITVAGRRPAVLDIGGGSGAVAVPLARAGAQVTVVDISADALATLRRRAAEAGVGDLIRPVQADAEALSDPALATVVAPGAFDLVLAHGILDAVDDAAATFAGCARAVRAGGLLSVLVSNPPAAVLARALAGDPAAALVELRALATPATAGTVTTPATRVDPARVVAMSVAAGFLVEARHGIGVFSDLVPGSALEAPGAREAVAALDAEAADRTPFAELAARIHVLARRRG